MKKSESAMQTAATTPVETHPTDTMSEAEVEEFRRIMRECAGIELSLEEAWGRAQELVMLYRMLLGPIPEDPEGRDGRLRATSH